jgi:chlorosome envelope protein E
MADLSGVFTNGAAAYGRLLEVFIDGHWWVVGDALENVGKCTKRLGANAYPQLYGGTSTGFRGASPKVAGYAKPTKEVEQRFRD